jgi:hypothetical protein
MTTEITDYISVRGRAAELGCVPPQRIAILPVNFASVEARSDFLQLAESATVRTLFRTNAIPTDEILPSGERCPYIHNKAYEWIAPTLFISAALWSENPMAVNLALNVIANYITDYFKGAASEKPIKLEFVVEKRDGYSCKKLTYEGDISGINDLSDIISEIADE